MTEIKGYAELKLSLDKISKEVADPKFLDNAGQFVRSQAVLFAPKGTTGYLQQNINYESEKSGDGLIGHVFTDVEYSVFVEMGTGRKGAANHDGISPQANPVYRMTPWMIPVDKVDEDIAEMYHWKKIYGDSKDGEGENVIGYLCYGQPAQPFMYPALHENEDVVADMLDGKLEEIIND